MNPICEKCFSPSTVPICGSPTTYPSSLNAVLFSPSVLGSIGASVCKYYKVNPAIGVIAGVVLGGVISIVQENRQTKLIGNRGSRTCGCKLLSSKNWQQSQTSQCGFKTCR